jgi:transposase
VLLPHLGSVVIEAVTDCGAGVVLHGRLRAEGGPCPRCGQVSVRAHSRYQRRLADAPIGGRAVQLQLQVRRLFCDNTVCATRTFVQQPAALTAPRSRHTSVRREALTAIAVALAGRAGARLAARLGMPTGRDTLLRLLRGLPDPQIGELPVLGVDDFALRRGHVYGTVVINMITGRPVELLPDRESATLAAWLREQPGVAVICRDRAGAYAEAARLGAPGAVQVADRWHLWRNLGQAVEKTVTIYRANLAITHPAGMAEAPTTSQTSTPPVIAPAPEKKIIVRMREQHAAVHGLVGQGLSKAAIGRQLGLHPATVRKLAQAATVEDLTAKTEQRAHLVDGYVEYLHRHWNEGERNATGLFREIAKLGYQGGELAVQRYLRRFRDGRGHAPVPGPKPPTVREVTSWVMTHPDRLGSDEASHLRQIRDADAGLDRLTTHVRGWATMMAELRGQDLEQWIVAVEQDTLAPLASFARNLRRDQDAVHAGLTLPHSSGRVEGTVNKIKMLKRQMFGRANFDLLRTRVLHAS